MTTSSVPAAEQPLSPNSNDKNVVARYALENEMLAINSDRTQYVLLTSHELDIKCTNVVKDVCTIYPVHLSKACLVALFMEKANAIKTFCEKVVHVSNLPLAQYISDGQRAVSTVQELKFSQVCPTSERGTETTIRSVGWLAAFTDVMSSCTRSNNLIPIFSPRNDCQIS